jgi:hypothetical protein
MTKDSKANRPIIIASKTPKKAGPKEGKSANKSIFQAGLDIAKGRYTGKSGMANIVRDVAMLRSMLNTENKHVDTTSGLLTVIPTASSIFLPLAVAEGTDDNQRTGRSIKVDRLDIMIQFIFNDGTTGTVSNQIFRYFIVKWLKGTSSVPSPTISQFLTQDASTNYSTLSFPNSDTSEDFKILDQGMVTVQQQYSNSQVSKVVDISIPLNFHQTYSSTTAASQEDGFLAVIFVSQTPIGTAGASAVLPSCRMYYIDN